MEKALRWVTALLLFVAPPSSAGTPILVVQGSQLAGYRYYAAAEVWPAMKPGDSLDLVREPENMHDGNAVRVLWKGRLLGYLPRHDNDHVAAQLDRGAPVKARIVKLTEHRNRSRRMEFEIYVDL